MANFVKFNRKQNKAFATGSSKDADTIYFTTDTHQIVLGGQVYGDYDYKSLVQLVGSNTAIGTATQPVYWDGSAFVQADAYPTVGDGVMSVLANGASVFTFSANQTSSGNIDFVGKKGVSVLSETNQVIISGVNHHKVATKTEVVRAKKKLGSLFLQGIKCENLGGLLYVANLNDISNITANPSEKAPDNANTATYIKSVVDDDYWIGLLTIDSTAGRYAFNITVEHSSGYKEHYKFLVIEDTPPTGTFSFVTDCPWIMTARYTTNKLACFAKLPEDFIGSVKVQLNRAHVTSGGNVGSFGSWDKTPADFMLYIDRTISTGGDKTYTTKFTTEEVNSKWDALDRKAFPEKPGGSGPVNPLGKYADSVNMVVDLGPVNVGDFVADFEINDILLHSLESAVGNHEVRISALESGTANYYHVPAYPDEGLLLGAGIGVSDMYVPKATADQLGVIQLGYTTNDKNYAVVVDANDRAYVNVPWTDKTLVELVGSKAIGSATRPVYWNGSNFVQANTYPTVPSATSSQLGVVKLFDNIRQSVAANKVSTTVGRTYGVQLNDSGQMVVNVPWTDKTLVELVGSKAIGSATRPVYWNGSNFVQANTYPTVPQATASQLGGIKLGYTTNDKNYAVAVDTNGKAYVNVPWTDKTLVELVGSKAIGSATRPVYWNGSNFVQANTYPTVPQATASQLGGIKLGYTSSGNNHAVKIDTNGKAYVEVSRVFSEILKASAIGNGEIVKDACLFFSIANNIDCNVICINHLTDGNNNIVNGYVDVYLENGYVGNKIELLTDGTIWYNAYDKNSDSHSIHTFDSDIAVMSNNNHTGKVSADGGFFQTSDIRKKNVLGELDLNKAYDLIDKCQTIIYSLKNNPNKEQIGLIAQEVQQFFPEIISEDEEGMLSLDYAKLTVVILRVLKDLIARVSKLESK